MQDSESQLARLRGQSNALTSVTRLDDGIKAVKTERRSISPVKNRHQSKPELIIPAVTPKVSQKPIKSSSKAEASPPVTGGKSDKSRREQQSIVEVKDKGTKRKFG